MVTIFITYIIIPVFRVVARNGWEFSHLEMGMVTLSQTLVMK